MQQLRHALSKEGKLVGICMADGAFSYSAIGIWQYIITPQSLPRDGSACSDPRLAKTVAKHRAGIEHLVGKFKQARSCIDAFSPFHIETAQLNVFLRATIINLNQMVHLGWTKQKIRLNLSSSKGKLFLDPFRNAYLSPEEIQKFTATPQKDYTFGLKRFITLLCNCAIGVAFLHDDLNITFANYKRARKLMESGHISMVDYAIDRHEQIIVRAAVIAAYYNRQHLVIIKMSPLKPVDETFCTCLAAKDKNIMCQHVTSVILKLFQLQVSNGSKSDKIYAETALKVNETFHKLYSCPSKFSIINSSNRTYVIQQDSPMISLKMQASLARSFCSVKLQKYSTLMSICRQNFSNHY